GLHLGLIMGVMFCAVGVELIYQSWLPSFLELERGFERTIAAASLTAVSVGLVLGRAAMGLVAGRWDPYRLLAVLMAGCALAALAAMLVQSPVLAVALFGLASLLAAGGFPTAISLGTAELRSNVGSATGLIVASAGIAGMTFPPISGVLAENGQFDLVMLLPAPLALLGAGLVLIARMNRRQAGHS
ncbi:MAG: MFS transporter, partial [Chloroflexi bacterium]|nr:MFS transporter [Chloroflexota bacterium]